MTGTNRSLALTNLQIVYDRAIEAVRDVSLEVPEGCIVALLGSNGAGKSTVLKAVSGVLYPEEGEVTGGAIAYRGDDLRSLSPEEIVRRGIVQVPEGRALFDQLSIEENLAMGGYTLGAGARKTALDRVYALFPWIAERRQQTAGYLSGGEQQMVAIGRALMSGPKLLMLDEPSLGLAPQIIETIFAAVTRLNREEGLTLLLVEQNANLALAVAHYGYIMESGRVVLDGTPQKLLGNADVREFYLGVGKSAERRSMREVKHYKRRKRWLS
jgi:branched-chain amino acid transport system ATP-binding protein